MHLGLADIAALGLVLSSAALIALTVTAVGPTPQGPVATTTREAPGSEPRAQGRESSARRTRRRGAGRRTARPAARKTPTPAPAPAAEPAEPVPETPPAALPREPAATAPPATTPPADVVEGYYEALNARRFEDAWAILTPAVRASFGPFEAWRAGYAPTLSSSPRGIEVASDGAAAAVAHELVAQDRSACGPVERTFAVSWRLEPAPGGGWRATSLTAVKRAGPEPGDACRDRQDAARATGGSPAG